MLLPVPDDLCAMVMIRPHDLIRGDYLMTYHGMTVNGAMPVPLRPVARLLRGLADLLEAQADEMDNN